MYYVIQHVKTGQLMPYCRGRSGGYTHWNPATKTLPLGATETPRLFDSEKKAKATITQWITNPNLHQVQFRTGQFGEEVDYVNESTQDGRSKDDLVIRTVRLLLLEEKK